MKLLFLLIKLCILNVLLEQVYSIQVSSIHRIPDQPIQLYSGGSVVLICTVTTNTPNTTLMIEWFNSSQSLRQVNNSLYITQPYHLGNNLWQSGLDLRILTVGHTGSYRCQGTNGEDEVVTSFYNIQVEDTGNQASTSISVLQSSLYAQLPFYVNSTLILPAHVSPQVKVNWYRNGAILQQLYNNISTVFINNTHVTSSLLVTEYFPVVTIRYTCVFIAELFGIEIFTLNKTTDSKTISSYPKLPIMISTDPMHGPKVNQDYSVTCTVSKPSVNGTLDMLQWRRNGLIVKSIDDIVISEMITTATGWTLTMSFTNNIQIINEDTYTCTASFLMEEYNNVVLSNSSDILINAPGRIINVRLSLYTIFGTSQVLTCTVETNKPLTNVSISWENDIGPVMIGSHHNITTLSNTLYQSILEIHKTQVYYCDAYSNGLWQEYDWYQIITLNTPNISITISNSSTVIPNMGERYNLTCTSNITGDHSIEWRRHNEAIIQSDNYHTVSSHSLNSTHVISILTFHSLQVNDAGGYLCSVTFGGSVVHKSNSIELQIKAPIPKVNIMIVNRQRVQCSIEFSNTYKDITVNVTWLFQRKGQQNIIRVQSLQNNVIIVSELNTIVCSKEYSQYIELIGNTTVELYSNITCQVNINGYNPIIISSSSSASLTNSIMLKPPLQPNNVTVTNIGTHWIVIQWNSLQPLITFEVQYGAATETHYNTHSVSTTSHVYTALLTNLQPGTHYSAVIVAINEYGMRNESNVIEFITNETIPTGAPLNFSYEISQNITHIFTWNPPITNQRNGLIFKYQFQCISLSLSSSIHYITNTTNISINRLMINSNYTCSVSAINSAGIGPSTILVFSYHNSSRQVTSEGVSDMEGTFSLNTYLLIPVNALLVLTVVIIVMLTVATCYYKRKYTTRNSYEVSSNEGVQSYRTSPHSIVALDRPPHLVSPSSRKPSQRYVSTDMVEFLLRQSQQHSTNNDNNRVDLTLTRQESLV